MNDKAIKKLMQRLYMSYPLCDTLAAQNTLDALSRAHQSYLSNSNSGNVKAAHEAWQNVKMLAHEVKQLELGGVIQFYEGDL